LAAQNFNYGRPYTQELEDKIIEDMSQSYVQGLTLLGGEPFLNTWVCLKLINRVRKEFGHTKIFGLGQVILGMNSKKKRQIRKKCFQKLIFWLMDVLWMT
jgi:organic radical activating enzyme